mgnify:CR=1 FL=1
MALTLALGATLVEAQGVSAPPNDFLKYAQFLYPFALSVAAVLAVVMIVIAGLEMMTASEGLREDAKKKIWAAVLGLLLAVGSYLILNTINPDLVQLKLLFPTVNTSVRNPGEQLEFGCNTLGQCVAGVSGGCGACGGGRGYRCEGASVGCWRPGSEAICNEQCRSHTGKNCVAGPVC